MFDRQPIHIAMLLWGGIFSFIAAICMIMNKNYDAKKRKWMILMQLCCAFLLANDASAWAFRGVSGTLGYWMVRISNFFVFFLSDVLLFFFHGYLCCCLFGKTYLTRRKQNPKTHDETGMFINKNTKASSIEEELPIKRIKAVYLIAVIGEVLVIVSQFTHLYYYIDADNIYHRNHAYIVAVIVPMIGILLDLTLTIKYRKRVSSQVRAALITYMVLPFAAAMVLSLYYGISLVNIAISICVIFMFAVTLLEQSKNLADSEREASNLRVELMLSQITPHFIYNTLTTIAAMCDFDPAMAKETTVEFSQYLRGNLNSVQRNDCVPFEEELSHTKYYTAIEQKRFGERVHVEYDVADDDFMIPPLTLQPLVENAIKHGLRKKEEGGTVRVHTERTQDAVYVTVTDDGAGFDKEEFIREMKTTADRVGNKKLHVGLKNVESRLESMCGGSLRVESEKGKGTIAMITLPQPGGHKQEDGIR